MEARIDYLEDEDGDLLFIDGDLGTGESDFYHIRDLVEMEQGELREYPTIGAGAEKNLNSNVGNFQKLNRAISVNLEADGYDKLDVKPSDGGLNISTR